MAHVLYIQLLDKGEEKRCFFAGIELNKREGNFSVAEVSHESEYPRVS